MTDEEKRKLVEKLNRLRVEVGRTLGQHVDDILEEFVGPIMPPKKKGGER